MFTTRQRYLFAIADRWGGLDVSSFSQRLLLQKRVFFLSMLGVNLGYSHTWYIRGPYSTGLTKDAFNIVDGTSADKPLVTSLPLALTHRLGRIEKMFGNVWNDPMQMELLASLYYLAKQGDIDSGETLKSKLRSLKGHFTDEQIDAAILWLSERDLINV